MDVIKGCIEGPTVEFQYRTGLVGPCYGRLRSLFDQGARDIEYAGGRDRVAFAELGIQRPVSQNPVPCGSRWQPRVVTDTVSDEGRSTDAVLVFVEHAAEAAHNLAVVLVLIEIQTVMSILDAGGDNQLGSGPPFKPGIRLRYLRNEMFVEVG